MKKIVALLICCCLLFTGCAEFVESEKKRISKEIDWIKDTVGNFTETIKQGFDDFSGVPSEDIPTDITKLTRSIHSSSYNFLYNHCTDIGLNIPAGWEIRTTDDLLAEFNYLTLPVQEFIKYDYTDFYLMPVIPDFSLYYPKSSCSIDGYFINLNHSDHSSYTNAEEYADYLLNGNWPHSTQIYRREEDIVKGERPFISLYREGMFVDGRTHTEKTLVTDVGSDYIFVLKSTAFNDTQIADIEFYIYCDSSHAAAGMGYSPTRFELCRSIFSKEKKAFYNPYLDYGFNVPYGWIVTEEEKFVDGYNGLSAAEILSADSNALSEMAYIPDFSICYNNYFNRSLEVYIHNLSADERYSDDSIKNGDEYALINEELLKNLGYENVVQLDDIEIGDDIYQIVFGFMRKDGTLHHSRSIASQLTEKGYAVNFDVIAYNETFPAYNLKDEIFNQAVSPILVADITRPETEKNSESSDADNDIIPDDSAHADIETEMSDESNSDSNENEKTERKPSPIRDAVLKLNSNLVWIINLAVLAVVMCFTSFIADRIYKKHSQDFAEMSYRTRRDIPVIMAGFMALIILSVLMALTHGWM